MHVERYLGEQREPAGGAAEPMSPHNERRWSAVAHLSVLAHLVGLAPFGALVVRLLYKDRSPRVRFHALQILVTVVLSIVTLGVAALVLVPLAFVLAVAPLAHWCYAAYSVNGGVDYRYPFIADRIDGGARRVF